MERYYGPYFSISICDHNTVYISILGKIIVGKYNITTRSYLWGIYYMISYYEI
jgi:hypothetical protein